MSALLHWRTAVDFIVLAVALYGVLRWATEARAVRVALGVIALLSGSLAARAHRLPVTSLVLEAAGFLVVAALLIVFQAEVRRAFTRLDTALLLVPRRPWSFEREAAAIAEAAFFLARRRTGALVVLARADSIDELVQGGTELRADLSAPLLESIFQKDSPLHDGAVIVEGGRVSRASVLLPLTNRDDLPRYFGTRHRSAVGLAERCDALVVVASEERGTVTLMAGRKQRPVGSEDELADALAAAGRRAPPRVGRVLSAVVRHPRTKLSAIGLAGLIWILAVSTASTVYRTVTVPVVLQVPTAMDVAAQSATTLTVQLRGPLWILDTSAANDIVARVNMAGAGEGWTTRRVTDRDLSLPPGVEMERASPPAISVRLVRRESAKDDRPRE